MNSSVIHLNEKKNLNNTLNQLVLLILFMIKWLISFLTEKPGRTKNVTVVVSAITKFKKGDKN